MGRAELSLRVCQVLDLVAVGLVVVFPRVHRSRSAAGYPRCALMNAWGSARGVRVRAREEPGTRGSAPPSGEVRPRAMAVRNRPYGRHRAAQITGLSFANAARSALRPALVTQRPVTKA